MPRQTKSKRHHISGHGPHHTRDSHCAQFINPATDTCGLCGAVHGDPCPRCGGRAYHERSCCKRSDKGRFTIRMDPVVPPGTKRFTVLRINGDDYDTHAARSFQAAMESALPDRGSRIDVIQTYATDAGAARLPSTYAKNGRLVRSFIYKGRS